MPTITDPQASLTLGPLNLMEQDPTGPFWFKALSDGHDLGNPEPVEREIESLLLDGSIVTVDSYGNRVMTIPIAVCAEDSPGLAAGEAALMEQVRRRNVLVWTPPNIITGSGDPCVFDVVNSEPAYNFTPGIELSMLHRWYTITIKALPHARSAIQRNFSIAFPPSGAVTTIPIDDMSVAGGGRASWSVWRTPGTLAQPSDADSLYATWANNTNGDQLPAYLAWQRSDFSVDMTATPYLRIDFAATGGGRYGDSTNIVWINGIQTVPAASSGSVSWYRMPAGVTTLHELRVQTQANVGRYGVLTLRISDVARSSAPQDAAASTRQVFGTVDVAGSVRTEATLALADETPTGLGSVLLYTSPNVGPVAQPPLRARLVAGPVETTDSSLVSGKYSNLGTSHAFDVPATQLADGAYLLLARVKDAAAGTYTLTWDAKARMGGTTVATVASGSAAVTLAAGVWTMVPVALIPLPGYRLGGAGLIRIDLSSSSGVLLDEAWLFNMTTGSLTQVECGTGTPAAGGAANRAWIDPASLDQPSASVTIGTAADRSDEFTPTPLSAWETHVLVAGSNNIFAVASGSGALEVDGYYYPRFLTHVVEPVS